MHKYAQICINIHKYAQICTNTHNYAQICTNMHDNLYGLLRSNRGDSKHNEYWAYEFLIKMVKYAQTFVSY